jgi:hypothetical protein
LRLERLTASHQDRPSCYPETPKQKKRWFIKVCGVAMVDLGQAAALY